MLTIACAHSHRGPKFNRPARVTQDLSESDIDSLAKRDDHRRTLSRPRDLPPPDTSPTSDTAAPRITRVSFGGKMSRTMSDAEDADADFEYAGGRQSILSTGQRCSIASSGPPRDSVLSSASGRIYLAEVAPFLDEDSPAKSCDAADDDELLEAFFAGTLPSLQPTADPTTSHPAETSASAAPTDDHDLTIAKLRQRVADLETYRSGYQMLMCRAGQYQKDLLEAQAQTEEMRSAYNTLRVEHAHMSSTITELEGELSASPEQCASAPRLSLADHPRGSLGIGTVMEESSDSPCSAISMEDRPLNPTVYEQQAEANLPQEPASEVASVASSAYAMSSHRSVVSTFSWDSGSAASFDQGAENDSDTPHGRPTVAMFRQNALRRSSFFDAGKAHCKRESSAGDVWPLSHSLETSPSRPLQPTAANHERRASSTPPMSDTIRATMRSEWLTGQAAACKMPVDLQEDAEDEHEEEWVSARRGSSLLPPQQRTSY